MTWKQDPRMSHQNHEYSVLCCVFQPRLRFKIILFVTLDLICREILNEYPFSFCSMDIWSFLFLLADFWREEVYYPYHQKYWFGFIGRQKLAVHTWLLWEKTYMRNICRIIWQIPLFTIKLHDISRSLTAISVYLLEIHSVS